MTTDDLIGIGLMVYCGALFLLFATTDWVRASRAAKARYIATLGLPGDLQEFAVGWIRDHVPVHLQRRLAAENGLDPNLFPEPPALGPPAASDEPIIAWRAWRVALASDDPTLGSMYVSYFWPAGQPAQADRIGDYYDGPPTGIHAFRTKDALLATFEHDSHLVFGTVALWGRVIEHEHGYRAEFAYPQRLYVADAGLAQGLARAYGCEVEVLPSMDFSA
jgi:hypothetical protein